MKNKNNKSILKKRINDFFVKYFSFFVVFIIVIVFTYGTFFVLMPCYDNALKSIDELTKSENARYNKKIEDLNSLRKFLNVYSKILTENIDKVKNIIPDEYQKEDIFLGMQELINNNQLTVKSIDINQDKSRVAKDLEEKSIKSDGVGSYSINVDVDGINYDSLVELLDVFEKSAPLIEVNNFSFSPKIDNRTEVSNISLTTYYFAGQASKD